MVRVEVCACECRRRRNDGVQGY